MNREPNTLRVTAANSRDALAQIRAALGGDALVLSNRRTASGVEMIAARPQLLDSLVARPEPVPAPAPATAPDAAFVREMQEMRALTRDLSAQLGRLNWNEAARRRPLRAQLARRMQSAGFGEALTHQVTERLPDDFGPEQAQRWLSAALARNLPCGAEDIVARGGACALVGPTGVGKTTTVAKLAARCIVRHGAQSLGLVTTDSYRVGAFDQLRIYGKILGVPVHAANDAGELDQALAALAGKHLVLVDTVGIGQRDARMNEHLSLLARPGLERVLVLSAAAQAEQIEDAIAAYREAGLAGQVLTKIDEAVKLGGALDAAIRHRLPLLAVGNGQRVPEDLHAANAAYLVDRALRAGGGDG